MASCKLFRSVRRPQWATLSLGARQKSLIGDGVLLGAIRSAASCCRLFLQDHVLKIAVEPQGLSSKSQCEAGAGQYACVLDGTRSRRASDLVILFELSQPKLPNFILTRKEAASKPGEVCSNQLLSGQALDSSARGRPVVWDPDSRARSWWKRFGPPKSHRVGKHDLKGSGCQIHHPPHKRPDPSRRKAAMRPYALARQVSLGARHARFHPMGKF